MALRIRKGRYCMSLTPATIGVNVRTTGTQRARIRDLGPYFSKNSCECAYVSFSAAAAASTNGVIRRM